MKSLLPFALLIAGLSTFSACTPAEDENRAPLHLVINSVSNHSHLLSGGNALIEITTSFDSGDELDLIVNGIKQAATIREITDNLSQDSSAQTTNSQNTTPLYRYRALITGLLEGNNRVAVKAGDSRAELALVNYPLTGPIFSGPHQQPYFCLNQLAPASDGSKRRFAIGNGEFIDDSSTDDNCSLSTRVDYVYKSSDSDAGFKALEKLDDKPADLAVTTTIDGAQLPYIVRLETGTINRAIYQIAILHDPVDALPSALEPSKSWNERLIYTFGGGCEAGFFQADSTAGVLRDSMLSQGYAVASSTLNVNAQGGCNDVVSAETAMMVKEHFIENYGEPRYTIGNGGSGGAMQQLLIAGAYPGILDGLLPSMTFADAVTYFTDAQECASLLRNYFDETVPAVDEDIKTAIGGWSMWSVCDESLGQRPKRVAPDDCPAQIPESARYHPLDNPQGVRCSIYDGMKNIFGEKRYSEIGLEREVARAPHDNVGVQYGLATLNEGLIDTEFFLDLNEKIGGWDIDVNSTPQRTEADDEAIKIAYQTGRVSSGGAGLAEVPIIDDRAYLDDIGNFHASVYSFVTRARLERDNGHANNYILRRHGRDMDLADDNLALMDQWLANIAADTSTGDKLERIVNAKPAVLQDDCFSPGGERIVEAPQFDTRHLYDNQQGTCNQLFKPHAGLRLVAGGPLSNDVLKCHLKEIDYADYAVDFSTEQKQRLNAIFPDGVCDWSRPGVHQQVNQTWLSFGPSPVNRY